MNYRKVETGECNMLYKSIIIFCCNSSDDEKFKPELYNKLFGIWINLPKEKL